MVERSETQFEGFDCVKLANEKLALWITKSIGPRVIGLAAVGGENLFAVLPDTKIEYPDRETYYLRGGHRLWYAPEKPETTYIPDNQALEVLEVENGVELIQPIDQPTMIQKIMRIQIDPHEAKVEVNHRLKNFGENEFALAPWAITQIRPGGLAIFPQQTGHADPHGLLPNRHIVLWPYTPINSPHIHWRDEAVYLEANMTDGALKIGFPNPGGWMAYAIEDALFVKRAEYGLNANYLDRRASTQSYCCEAFIEFETLGPYASLQPGETVQHDETWEIFSEGEWPEEVATLYHAFE